MDKKLKFSSLINILNIFSVFFSSCLSPCSRCPNQTGARLCRPPTHGARQTNHKPGKFAIALAHRPCKCTTCIISLALSLSPSALLIRYLRSLIVGDICILHGRAAPRVINRTERRRDQILSWPLQSTGHSPTQP